MRILLTLEYDGAAYAGWQRQENALAVQQVVEEHRGRVEVEAAPEGGAAFTVTFPITPREAEPD